MSQGSQLTSRERRNEYALVQVKAIEGVFSQAQKEEMVKKITDTMVSIEGENLRQ